MSDTDFTLALTTSAPSDEHVKESPFTAGSSSGDQSLAAAALPAAPALIFEGSLQAETSSSSSSDESMPDKRSSRQQHRSGSSRRQRQRKDTPTGRRPSPATVPIKNEKTKPYTRTGVQSPVDVSKAGRNDAPELVIRRLPQPSLSGRGGGVLVPGSNTTGGKFEQAARGESKPVVDTSGAAPVVVTSGGDGPRAGRLRDSSYGPVKGSTTPRAASIRRHPTQNLQAESTKATKTDGGKDGEDSGRSTGSKQTAATMSLRTPYGTPRMKTREENIEKGAEGADAAQIPATMIQQQQQQRQQLAQSMGTIQAQSQESKETDASLQNVVPKDPHERKVPITQAVINTSGHVILQSTSSETPSSSKTRLTAEELMRHQMAQRREIISRLEQSLAQTHQVNQMHRVGYEEHVRHLQRQQ